MVLKGCKKSYICKPSRNPVWTFLYIFCVLVYSLLFYSALFWVTSPVLLSPWFTPGKSLAWFPLQGQTQLAFTHYLCLSVFPCKKMTSFFLSCCQRRWFVNCGCSFSLSKLWLLILRYKHLEFALALASPTWLCLLCGKCYHDLISFPL